ncbi:MAG: clostripain-related cysteine peptidase [Pseudomonadota bacterium]
MNTAKTNESWLIMIYLAGDNNLAQEMVVALQALSTTEFDAEAAVVAELDMTGRATGYRYDFTKSFKHAQLKGLAKSQAKTGQNLTETQQAMHKTRKVSKKRLRRRLENFRVSESSEKHYKEWLESDTEGKELQAWVKPDDSNTVPGWNTGDPEALSDFILWARKRYRSHKTMLLLSGHGDGVLNTNLMRDDRAGDSLTIVELREALKKGLQIPSQEDTIRSVGGSETQQTRPSDGKLDIIAFDACHMSMLEVAIDLEPYANILIGSEGLESGDGWPYARILEAASEAIDRDSKSSGDQTASVQRNQFEAKPEVFAKLIIHEYVEYYKEHGPLLFHSADLSAIDLRKVENLRKAVNDLSLELSRTLQNLDSKGATQNTSVSQVLQGIIYAHWRAQTYWFDQYVDLKDFCEQLGSAYGVPESAKSLSAKVIGILRGDIRGNGGVVIAAGCCGYAYQNSYGLSLYFPWNKIIPGYGSTGAESPLGDWRDFIAQVIDTTRRHVRRTGRSGGSDFEAVNKSKDANGKALEDALDAERDKAIEESTKGFMESLKNLGMNPNDHGALWSEISDNYEKEVSNLLKQKCELLMRSEMAVHEAVQIFKQEARSTVYTQRTVALEARVSSHRPRVSSHRPRVSSHRPRGDKIALSGGVTRTPESRQRQFKNLPPVEGYAYWPISEAALRNTIGLDDLEQED